MKLNNSISFYKNFTLKKNITNNTIEIYEDPKQENQTQ